MMKKLLFLVFSSLSISIFAAGSLELHLENDILAIDDDSDYTHGTQIGWMMDSEWSVFDNYGVAVQQNMYTPGNLRETEPIYDDRPYCGYLSLNFIGDNYYDFNDRIQLTMRNVLGIGAVGPASLAGDTQRLIHKWLNCKEPHWTYQIKNEPILEYENYLNLNIDILRWNWFGAKFIPRTGLMLGNFKDQIEAGVDLKLGILPKNNIGQGIMVRNPNKPSIFDGFQLYLIGGVSERYVARDITLDGNTWRHSYVTVDRKEVVDQYRYGAGISIWNLDVDYLILHNSKEYKQQDESEEYGTLTISLNFNF